MKQEGKVRRGAAIAAVIALGLCLILSVLFTLVYASFALGEASAPVLSYLSAGLGLSVLLIVLIRKIASCR